MMNRNTADIQAFVKTLQTLWRHPNPALRNLFTDDAPVSVARAPGRLDVMGGIADYSGALVLQWPIAEATFVALQPSGTPVVRMVSWTPGRPTRSLDMDLTTLAPGGQPIAYPEARQLFDGAHWAAYVAGVFLVLMQEREVRFDRGANLLISSAVPEGKGVASSAALEVSVIHAVEAAFDIGLGPEEAALLCQKAENLVAGAPCGVMDQMACTCGEANSLLALVCQPARLESPVKVPGELAFWGLDSGERHEVTGSDYESVRIGTFMGHRLMGLADGEYLANTPRSTFERDWLHRLPESLSGADFLADHAGTSDTVTRVAPSRIYKVRHATAHAVYEQDRVSTFRQCLESAPDGIDTGRLGGLMYASHASYSACGLGSPGTDLLVELVRSEGPENGLYGARITGGGSGGTVAVLGDANAGGAIARVVERYANATGYHAYVFSGSSDGAAAFGSIHVDLSEMRHDS